MVWPKLRWRNQDYRERVLAADAGKDSTKLQNIWFSILLLKSRLIPIFLVLDVFFRAGCNNLEARAITLQINKAKIIQVKRKCITLQFHRWSCIFFHCFHSRRRHSGIPSPVPTTKSF